LKLSGVARVFMGRVEDVVVSDIPVNEGTLEVDWTAIYAAQRERLFGLALIILQEGNDAADAVQSAFEKGFRHRDQLRRGVGPEAWLAKITCNEAISLARRRRIRRWVTFVESEAPAIHEEAAIVDRIAVEDALRHLRPKHRAVVALHYLHGYGIDEIGSILEIPRGTVASRLHHARETLRRTLAKHRTES
jgi:RNA polymerase sigma-70 factor, ECF subfamily